MKRLFVLIIGYFMSLANGYSQNILKHAPQGFDSLNTEIPHGKIDTITYFSTTVGNNRRAIIYTPPGYSNKRKYPARGYVGIFSIHN